MSDFLLELSRNPTTRSLVQSLGLPISLPQDLKRARGADVDHPLDGHEVLAVGTHDGEVWRAIAQALVHAGATPCLHDDLTLRKAFADVGEAFARPARLVSDADAVGEDAKKIHGVVFDATGLAHTADLQRLYETFHPWTGAIAKNGRAVVVSRAPEQCVDAETAAVQSGLEGFVRSLAKELGKRGATAQLLVVEDGGAARLEGPLRFVLSRRSAFVSGQPLRVSARARLHDAPHRDWTRPLDGKIAVVTGAARGIGEATVQRLSEEGAHVVCLDRPQDDALCAAVARRVGGTPLLVDVSAESAADDICRELETRFGGVHVFVHNAGITRDKTIARMKPEQWSQAIDVNLTAVVRISKALFDGPMHDDGRMIVLSSIAGIAGNLGQTNYATAKSGLVAWTRNRAAALAPRGITVNAVAPGFIETRLTAAIPFTIREAGRRLSNLAQGGLPEDVGNVITFLATPQAAGLTGNVVRVCGGALIGS
jgi:3-oxoacyl-[acyl-carrier protein] reductase